MTAISKRCLVCVVVVILTVLSHVWCLDITKRVFGDNTNYLPAAFGDFNSDKLTDLFVVTEDGKTVKVLVSHNEPPLMHANSQEMPNCTYKSLNIRSVVPGDFDGNGEMDVMIVSLNKDISPLYQIFILWGNLDNMTLDCGKEDVPLLSLSGQPLVMDYNGDMIPDLFGENENHTRMFWVFSSHRIPPQPVLMTKDTSMPHLKRPSSHGFVDMTNDLAADLWVTAEGQFEVWKITGDGYVLDKVINPSEYMKRIGQTSFADVNLDGHIDALVPACKDDSCKQSAVFVRDYESDLWIDVEVSFVDQSGNTWSYPTEVNSKFRHSDTITLHVGDFNLDGFPDFLVTLFNKDKARVTLMENAPCEDAKCRYKRKFIPHWNLFGEFNDTVLGTFCDFEEDGTLDVLLVRKGGDDKYHLSVYKDATEYDAVFVKELALSPEECSPAVMFTRYFIPILDGHSPAANPEMDLEDALCGLESTMLSFPMMLEEVVSSPQRAMVEQDPRYAKSTLPGMPGGEPIHRGFSKGAWSPFGMAENGRCILCLVTRDHRLILCGCVGRHWVVLASLAEEWYRYNASQAWKRTNLPPSSPSHLHYAARITLLGVSQVLWTPVYEDQRGRYSMLITFMGKGCVVFWRIETNFKSVKQASIFSVCDSNMTNISAAHWDSLSDKCGYLIVGNTSGQIKIFFCQFNSSDVYFKKLGFIWESTDMLSVRHIHMTHVDAWQYLVIFSKHNIVMASSVSLSEASLSVSHTSHVFIGDLEVSGIIPFENHNIYISSKDGLVKHIRLHVTEDGDTAIEEREMVFSSDDVLYSGMASSPNSTLIAVFEMIKVAYDHLVEREPTLVNIYRLGDAAKLTQSLFESPKDVHQNADIFESLRISICKTGHCPINFLQTGEIEDQPLSVLKVHYWLTKIARSCGITDDAVLGTLSEVEPVLQKAILENSILNTLRFCEGDQPKAGSVVQSLIQICDWIRRHDPANAAMVEKKLKKLGGFKMELCPVCKKEVPLDFLTHGRCSSGHTLPRCCWTLLLTEPTIMCPRCRVYCHKDSDFLSGTKGEYCCTYCDGFMRKQLVGRN